MSLIRKAREGGGEGLLSEDEYLSHIQITEYGGFGIESKYIVRTQKFRDQVDAIERLVESGRINLQ